MKNNLTPQVFERYYLGTCTSLEAFEVEEWLSSQNKTKEEIEMINAIFERINDTDDYLADKAYEKCASTLNIASKKKRGSAFAWISIPVAFACIALGIFIGKQKDETPTSFREVYAQRGESEIVVLPDSSIIFLKSGSRLIYPTEFVGGKREAFLSGECYASIYSDPEHPFILSTGLMNVCITGTEFNIKSFPEDSEVEVALIKGCVHVEGRSDSSTPLKSIVLEPGNIVKVDRENGETRICEFNVDNYNNFSEKGKSFVFLDRRFSDIVNELSRDFDTSIVLMDHDLGEKRYYSSFVNGEALMDMLNTFNVDNHMQIQQEGSVIRISSKK